jgi:hypothetical protein
MQVEKVDESATRPTAMPTKSDGEASQASKSRRRPMEGLSMKKIIPAIAVATVLGWLPSATVVAQSFEDDRSLLQRILDWWRPAEAPDGCLDVCQRRLDADVMQCDGHADPSTFERMRKPKPTAGCRVSARRQFESCVSVCPVPRVVP